jgi:hypothetical protein
MTLWQTLIDLYHFVCWFVGFEQFSSSVPASHIKPWAG